MSDATGHDEITSALGKSGIDLMSIPKKFGVEPHAPPDVGLGYAAETD